MTIEDLVLAGYSLLRFICLGFGVGYGIAMLRGFYKDRRNVRNRDAVLVFCVAFVVLATLVSLVTSTRVGVLSLYTAALILAVFRILMWSVPSTRRWGQRKVIETKDDVV